MALAAARLAVRQDAVVVALRGGNEFAKDEMVGVLLVASSKKDVPKRKLTVYVLANHDGARKKGLAAAMWQELVSKEGKGEVQFEVSAGPCLNNADSRAFYTKLGFRHPKDNKEDKDSLNVVLNYIDGTIQK